MIDFPNLPNISSVGRTSDRRPYTPGKKDAANPILNRTESADVVQISADAVYKGKLSVFSAALAKEMEAADTEHVVRMKEAYAGDCCPVSPHDLAGAILARILSDGSANE
jgi:hypothetical protein